MSKIEWCDKTINPIIGCSKISPGCENCYAEKMACRLANMALAGNNVKSLKPYIDVTNVVADRYERDDPTAWNGKTVFRPSELEKVSTWKKPRRIFVGSMGDIFHNSVRFSWIKKVFEVAFNNPQHTFIFLTKRPENMKEAVKFALNDKFDDDFWITNIWLGVTAENQEQADKRIPILLKIPAPVRFVSVEPMLGPIDISNFNYVNWVICGGESGNNARPMHGDWLRDLRDQCRMAYIPFFFKQWGEWGPRTELGLSEEDPECKKWPNVIRMCTCGGDGRTDIGMLPMCNCSNPYHIFMQKCGKKRAGRKVDGQTYEQFPD